MSFADALQFFETICPRDDKIEPTETYIVTSGGIAKDDKEPPPALYGTKDMAIAKWRVEMLGVLSNAKKSRAYKFLDGPHLEKFQITIAMNRHGIHRVAEDRYSVTAKVGIAKAANVPATR